MKTLYRFKRRFYYGMEIKLLIYYTEKYAECHLYFIYFLRFIFFAAFIWNIGGNRLIQKGDSPQRKKV